MDKLNPIIQEIKAKKCVIFFGAGISNIAGYDRWNDLLNKIIKNKLIKKEVKKCDLKNFDGEIIMEHCKRIFYKNGQIDTFWGYIKDLIYYFDSDKFSKDYIPFINQLKNITPFPKLLLTTNIDHLLETVKLVPSNKIYGKVSKFKYINGVEGLFHIHGSIEEGIDKLVLTDSQYSKRYKNTKFIKFIKDVAKNNTIMFIGYSLERVIKSLLKETQNSGKKHYLLVPEESKKLFNDSIYSNMWNVNVIVYGKMKEFPKIFEDWIKVNFTKTLTSIESNELDVSKID